MKRNCDVMLGLRYSILLVFVLFISACAAKLVDIDKSLPKLNLSKEQLEVVEPKMMAIREIVDEYNAEKEQFEEELNNMTGEGMGRGGGGGDRSGLREKLQAFRKKREAYLSAIRIHVADIKAVLSRKQLIAFEKMELPELEMPEMPGGRRPGVGGRGGGGRPGGGRGGGGRRGGGMF